MGSSFSCTQYFTITHNTYQHQLYILIIHSISHNIQQITVTDHNHTHGNAQSHAYAQKYYDSILYAMLYRTRENPHGAPRAHDRTHHTTGKSSHITSKWIIRRPVGVTLCCRNTPTTWDQHWLQGVLAPCIFTLKAWVPKNSSQPLLPDSGPPKNSSF